MPQKQRAPAALDASSAASTRAIATVGMVRGGRHIRGFLPFTGLDRFTLQAVYKSFMLRKSRGGAVVEFDGVEKPEHPDQPELRPRCGYTDGGSSTMGICWGSHRLTGGPAMVFPWCTGVKTGCVFRSQVLLVVLGYGAAVGGNA